MESLEFHLFSCPPSIDSGGSRSAGSFPELSVWASVYPRGLQALMLTPSYFVRMWGKCHLESKDRLRFSGDSISN